MGKYTANLSFCRSNVAAGECTERGRAANEHFDRLFVPRKTRSTGDLNIHEIGIKRNGTAVFVTTKYSCLATFDELHSFKALWKPKFFTKLAPEDRCHLSGLAMRHGLPKYVTAVSQSDIVESSPII
jgi:uncharacterized protein (TIGR03032 family)